jgi:hypothetical protein
VALHCADALQRFERADENAASDSGDLGGDVEHKVIAIAEVNVGVAATKKHGAIPRGRPTKVVGGRVALRIGLGFDDSAAQASAGEFTDDNFADQKSRQGDGVRREFGATQAADGNGSFQGH